MGTKVLHIALLFVLIYAGVVTLAWIFQRRLIYLPMGQQVPGAGQVLREAEEVNLTTRDGLELAGWWAPVQESRGAVIVCNGNAGNRSLRVDLARMFRRLSFSVLLFDYRGFGGNPGSPSQEGVVQDAEAARRFVGEKTSAAEVPVVYYGESLGAAVAVALARRSPPDALILRSPFSSLTEMGRMHYPMLPVGLLLKDRFPVRRWIREVSCPLLVLAGEADRIVPPELSRAVYDAAPMEVKEFVLLPGVGHNDLAFYGGPSQARHVGDFLQRTIGADRSRPKAGKPQIVE